MVPPVLKILTINGLSLVVEGSTLSGETQEGIEEDEDNELTGVAGPPSREEPVDPGATWLLQELGDAHVFLRLLGVLTLAAGGSSSIGRSSISLTCANADPDNFINCLACRHLDSKVNTDVCGNRSVYSLSRCTQPVVNLM